VVASLLVKGVSGYIPASLDLEVTIQALGLVLAGGTYAPTGYLTRLWQATSSHNSERASEGLTTKQLAVVEAIRRGKPNKTIAYELNMCESTVKVHVRTIMKKLQARNRTHVAFIANQILAGGEKAAKIV
jgi:DNA-binding NarL/FixJ family response regulator